MSSEDLGDAGGVNTGGIARKLKDSRIVASIVNRLDKGVQKNVLLYKKAYIEQAQKELGEENPDTEVIKALRQKFETEALRVAPMSKISNGVTGVENGIRTAVVSAIAGTVGGVVAAAAVETAVGGAALGGLIAAASVGGILKGVSDVYGAKRAYENRLRGAFDSIYRAHIKEKKAERSKSNGISKQGLALAVKTCAPDYVHDEMIIPTIVPNRDGNRLSTPPFQTSNSNDGLQRSFFTKTRKNSSSQVEEGSPATETLKEILDHVAKGASIEESWQEKVSSLKRQNRVKDYLLLDKIDNNGKKEVFWISPDNQALVDSYKALNSDDKQSWIKANNSILIKYTHSGDLIEKVEAGKDIKNTIVPVFNSKEKTIKAIRLDGQEEDVVDFSEQKIRKDFSSEQQTQTWVSAIRSQDDSSRSQTLIH